MQVHVTAIHVARENAAAATRIVVMTAEFLSVASFALMFIVMFFVIKIYNTVKNIQATRNGTAVLENARVNQRALTTTRDFNDLRSARAAS